MWEGREPIKRAMNARMKQSISISDERSSLMKDPPSMDRGGEPTVEEQTIQGVPIVKPFQKKEGPAVEVLHLQSVWFWPPKELSMCKGRTTNNSPQGGHFSGRTFRPNGFRERTPKHQRKTSRPYKIWIKGTASRSPSKNRRRLIIGGLAKKGPCLSIKKKKSFSMGIPGKGR